MRILILSFFVTIFLGNFSPTFAEKKSREILERILNLKQKLNCVVMGKAINFNVKGNSVEKKDETELEKELENRKDAKVTILFHDDGLNNSVKRSTAEEIKGDSIPKKEVFKNQEFGAVKKMDIKMVKKLP
ncbi:hypothetical protein HYY75_11890 [bacterium]|nr:hypothetical protein [bacterium]